MKIQHLKLTAITLISLMSLLLSGCMESIAPKKSGVNLKLNTRPGFQGCLNAEGISTDKIRMEFEFPADAIEMFVYRDGIQVYDTINTTDSEFIDSDLMEGHQYSYMCKAKFKDDDDIVSGTNVVKAYTIAVNPPDFDGVYSVTVISSSTVKVRWKGPTGGAEASRFEVYSQRGTLFNIDQATLKSTKDYYKFETEISNLGDEIPYTFGVRACTYDDICSIITNTITKTLIDGGAPKTVGITKAEVIDGKVVLTMPWDETKGAVSKRYIYRSTSLNDLTSDARRLAIRVTSDIASGPETSYTDSTAAENTTYYYLVRDEDPTGNNNGSNNYVTIATGDLTAPIFPGLTGIAAGVPADTALRLTWIAIDPNDAIEYLVYLKKTNTTPTGPIITPDDPCVIPTTTAPSLIIPSSSYANGTTVNYNLTGLSERTTYRVCVKARDASGNTSSTLNSRTLTTMDITPPTFDGVQKIEYAAGNIKVTWNPSTSSDQILNYKVNIWATDSIPNVASVTTMTLDATTYSSSYTFGKGVFNYQDNQRIYIMVQACDNSYSNFTAAENTDGVCSSYPLNGATSTTKSYLLGDTTKPVFDNSKFHTIAYGSPANTNIDLTWTAIDPEVTVQTGTKYYIIYMTSKAGDNDPEDSCLKGTEVDRVTADSYPVNTNVSKTIGGLVERTTYSFCVKAADSAGNISDTTKFNKLLTKDITAPTFAGVSTFKFEDGMLKARWTASSSSDLESYRIKIWDNATGYASAVSYTKAANLISTGVNIKKVDDGASNTIVFNYQDNQVVKILVDACDNAFPTYNTASNCTAKSVDTALTVTLDDTTPPSFTGGLTGLEVVSPTQDSKVKLTWVAIQNQPADSNGAYSYRFFGLSKAGKVEPDGNPCDTGTAWGYVDSNDYTPGQTATKEISGLTERTTYSFCVKARDMAGNLSTTTVERSVTTQDITPPSFGTITGAMYNSGNGKIEISWAASNSLDTKEYKLQMWTEYADPIANSRTITTITIPHSTYSSPYQLTPSDYTLSDGAKVYFIVNACDDTADAGYGTQNCTTNAYAGATLVTLPDTTAPKNFPGIAATTVSTAQGKMRIDWQEPTSWVDFAGFKIYTVNSNNSLNFIQDCECIDKDCYTNHLTTCEVSGLNAYRNYKWHVRPYDAVTPVPNIAVLDPATKSLKRLTKDTTAPVFSSKIAASYDKSNGTIKLNWDAATDNQYALTDYINTTANVITYELYRKKDASFGSNVTTPFSDGDASVTKVSTQTTREKVESMSALVQGSRYYYVVCALDQSSFNGDTSNRVCDGMETSILIEDNIAPIINSFTVTDLIKGANTTWKINWSITDGAGTPVDQLKINVYRKFTNNKADMPTDDNFIGQYWGDTTYLAQDNQDNVSLYTFATYKITVIDSYGFSSSSTTYTVAIPIVTQQFGSNMNDVVVDIVTDTSGNIYVAGTAYGSLYGTISGGSDMFLAKYDQYGNRLWGKQFGTSGDDTAYDLVIDPSNNLYVIGAVPFSSYQAAYIKKYDSSGNLLATGSYNNGTYSHTAFAGTYYNGYIYTTGQYCDRSDWGRFGRLRWNATTLSQEWSSLYSGYGTCTFLGNIYMTNDSSGNIYVAGIMPNGCTIGTAIGGQDIFIQKFDTTGTIAYQKVFGTTTTDYVSGISIDSNNNLYVLGHSSGLIGASAVGNSDAFVVKFNTSLTQTGVLQFGTTFYDYSGGIFISNDEIFVTTTKYDLSYIADAYILDTSLNIVDSASSIFAPNSNTVIPITIYDNKIFGGGTTGLGTNLFGPTQSYKDGYIFELNKTTLELKAP